jgi:hypothetical protein
MADPSRRRGVSRIAHSLVVAGVVGLLSTACGDGTPGTSATTGTAAPTTSPPSTSAPSTTVAPTTTTTTPVPRPIPGGALEILVIGDSVMFDASAAIEAALEATGAARVQPSAVFGFGFSEGAALPFATAAADLLGGEAVDQVVVMVGSWDHLGVRRDAEGYAGSVAAALGTLAEGGRSVLVLGEPPSDPAKGEDESRLAVNQVLEAEAEGLRRVIYLDTDTVVGDRNGDYVRQAGGALLRKPDGRHLCPAGAARLGTAVLAELRRAWALPPADPAWEAGDWRGDARYDDPPGGCAP